ALGRGAAGVEGAPRARQSDEPSRFRIRIDRSGTRRGLQGRRCRGQTGQPPRRYQPGTRFAPRLRRGTAANRRRPDLLRRSDRAPRRIAAEDARRAAAARLGGADSGAKAGRQGGRAGARAPGRGGSDRRARHRRAPAGRLREARRSAPAHRGARPDVRPGFGGAYMTTLFDVWANLWTAWLGPQWGPPAWTLVKNTILILCIVLPLFACVAYLTLWERKLIGWMQIRLGPNRVGPLGLLQPIADAIKLMFKELIVPTGANKFLFIFAPMLTLMPALAAKMNRNLFAPDPLRSGGGARGHQRGAPLRHGDHLDGRLRRHHCRLGLQLEIRVPRRHALGGADRRLRDRDGLRAGKRVDGFQEPQPHRHRRGAESRLFRPYGTQFPLLELAAARAHVPGVLHLGPGPDPTA